MEDSSQPEVASIYTCQYWRDRVGKWFELLIEVLRKGFGRMPVKSLATLFDCLLTVLRQHDTHKTEQRGFRRHHLEHKKLKPASLNSAAGQSGNANVGLQQAKILAMVKGVGFYNVLGRHRAIFNWQCLLHTYNVFMIAECDDEM